MNDLIDYVQNHYLLKYQPDRSVDEVTDDIFHDIHMTGGDRTFIFMTDFGDKLRETVKSIVERSR